MAHEFNDIFSRRNKPAKPLQYNMPKNVRSRILKELDHQTGRHFGPFSGMGSVLADVFDMVDRAYGHVEKTPNWLNSYNYEDKPHTAAEHFMNCSDERAIDFIEFLFRSRNYTLGQRGVEAVNEILRQEGIGYEFSPYVATRTQLAGGGYETSTTLPKATVKTEELLHATAVMPALTALAHPRFKTANEELLNAYKHFRDGVFDSAVAAACQAFESVFKTICTAKGWAYDANRDTLARLVEICRDNQLFPTFYAEIFKNVGTIGNRMGRHGGGPAPVKPDAEHAESVIHLVASNTLLLIRLARL